MTLTGSSSSRERDLRQVPECEVTAARYDAFLAHLTGAVRTTTWFACELSGWFGGGIRFVATIRFTVDAVEQIVDVCLRNDLCGRAASFVRSFGIPFHQGAQGWFTTAIAVFSQQFQEMSKLIELVWESNVFLQFGSIYVPLLSENLKQECSNLTEPGDVSRSRLEWASLCLDDFPAPNLQRQVRPRSAAVAADKPSAWSQVRIGGGRESFSRVVLWQSPLDLVDIRAFAP